MAFMWSARQELREAALPGRVRVHIPTDRDEITAAPVYHFCFTRHSDFEAMRMAERAKRPRTIFVHPGISASGIKTIRPHVVAKADFDRWS